ncbi:MAG: MFS transporter [Xanthobacteraceae bacterium]|nr:MFS transporter [Xanthobacteraceae bacterium]
MRRFVPPDSDPAGAGKTRNDTTRGDFPDLPPRPEHVPTQRSLRGLDWFVFFVADVQTGFGPFVAVYLTAQKWTQVDIGLVLTVGSLVSLVGQMPGGAIVDAARSERLVAGLAIVAIAISALAYATSPIFPVILAAAVLHSVASCVLGPAMAAISLGLVGHAAMSERLGRNARFAAVGNGLAAAAMGACGYFLSARAVFFVTAGLLGPALLSLRLIAPKDVDPERAHGGPPERRGGKLMNELLELARKRRLLIFAGCIMLFHFANAAMLPLMGSVLTTRSSSWATVLIAACIVGPQVLVAIFSPWVGRKAQLWGRRPLLLAAFVALPLRGLAFAAVTNPYFLVAAQLLDGISAAVLAVMVPLVIADVTRGTGHFNLGQGIVGTMVGIGASISTTYAGYLSDHLGSRFAFLGLTVVALIGLAAIWVLMPETGPGREKQARCARADFERTR